MLDACAYPTLVDTYVAPRSVMSPEGQSYPQELRRSLRLIDLILYGIVFMSPIAAFAVFGFVREASHGAIALAYAIGCTAMMLTGLSYAEMARAVPVAGSVYHYARRSMGEAVGFIAGWSILLDYILLPALMILLGAVVMNSAVPVVPVPVWVLLFLTFATIVNVLGLKATTRTDIAIAAVLIGIVVVFVIAALFALRDGAGAGAITLAPVWPPGLTLSLAVSGASVAVLSFLGFDAISTLAEEVSGGDTRAVGRATIICLVVMGTIYMCVSWLLADLSVGVPAGDPGQAAFKIVATQIPWLGLPVTLAVGLGTGIGSAIAPQAAVARVLYAMARDRQLPDALARVHPHFRTPYVAVVSIAVVMAVVALGFVTHLDTLLSLCNFGALVAFMFVNASVIAYHRVQRRSPKLFRHVVLPAIGLAVIAYVLSGLSSSAVVLGAGWLALGASYYALLRFVLRRSTDLSSTAPVE
jgi:amino acid transporter